MHDADPFERRRVGAERVRQVTAAVAVAAVAGTGMLTWTLADRAAAAQPSSVVTGTDDDGGSLGGVSSDEHVSPPSRLPTTAGSGHVHASSESTDATAAADWTAWTCRVRVAVTDPPRSTRPARAGRPT